MSDKPDMWEGLVPLLCENCLRRTEEPSCFVLQFNGCVDFEPSKAAVIEYFIAPRYVGMLTIEGKETS